MKIIALTPARNEEERIGVYLNNALTWADHVIVADHRSSDGTVARCRLVPGVIVETYEEDQFDTGVRRFLLERCRDRFGAGNLLVFVDVDEALTEEGAKALRAAAVAASAPMVFCLPWTQLWGDDLRIRIDVPWKPKPKPIALLDDGEVTYRYENVLNDHGPRVPEAPSVVVDAPLLHFQFLDVPNFLQKQTWYQLREISSGRSPRKVFVQYRPSTRRWFVRTRSAAAIDMTNIALPPRAGSISWRAEEIRRLQLELVARGIAPAYWQPSDRIGLVGRLRRVLQLANFHMTARVFWTLSYLSLLRASSSARRRGAPVADSAIFPS
jgi:hypothetical protein